MSDPSPSFQRVFAAFDLPTRAARPIEIDASREECAAVSAQLGLSKLSNLSISAQIIPAGEGVWRVCGEIRAKVVQSCVVTLKPVKSDVAEPFDRLFSRYAEEDTAIDIDIEYDEEDPPDPLGDGIDIGAVATEALALGLDPYPRAPGAAFETLSAAPPGVEPISPEAAKPFAGLASLKKAMEGDE